MKKLIFATALALGSLTAVNAQEGAIAQTSTNEAKMAQTVAAQQAAATQGFTEVKASELPQAIQDAVTKDFKGASVSKAYKNAKGQYKLILTTADKQKKTVYANSEGQWLKAE
tara:strand:- start:636 stop:974 length:339 start_codon:yes stop_codon:yes gene_type:complete